MKIFLPLFSFLILLHFIPSNQIEYFYYTVDSVMSYLDNQGFEDDENQWYILVDTAILGSGTYNIVVDIDVPDNDFDDGFRHEVVKKELFKIKSV